MRRASALGVLVVLAACSGQTTLPLRGNLRQPADTLLVGDQLFISSLRQDALEVVQLSGGGTPDAFVPAPNPVFPLQIPVVRRPSAMAAVSGTGVRPVVAVVSAVDPQLRLVDADALEPLGAPVALPGRPLTVVADPRGGGFWTVVESEAGAQVVDVVLSEAARNPAATVGPEEDPTAELRTFPIDAVPGGLAMSEASGTLEAWISDLRAPEILRMEVDTGTVERIPTGQPLGLLEASPAVENGTVLPAGAYVYGSVYGGSSLIAVDVVERAVAAAQVVDGRIEPISLPSTPTAITGISRMSVAVPNTFGEGSRIRPGTLRILLLVPMINGAVAYVDGTKMIPVDTDGDLTPDPSFTIDPQVMVSENAAYTTELDKTAPVIGTKPNPEFDPANPGLNPEYLADVELTPGVTRSRTWRIAWKGTLPGLAEEIGRLSEDGAVVPSAPPEDLSDRVRPGDTLTIRDWYADAPPAGCTAYQGADLTYEVTAAEGGRIALTPTEGGAPLPSASCFPVAFVFEVRASGYTVTADDLEPVWRLAPGERFVYQGQRFEETTPSFVGPEIAFTLAEAQDPDQMSPGAERVLTVSSGLDPLLFVPVEAVSSCNQLRTQNFQTNLGPAALPGRVSILRDPDTPTRGRAYVPYTGSGYFISFRVLDRRSPECIE